MKIIKSLVMFIAVVIVFLQYGCGKENNSSIVSDISTKYKNLNGVVDDAKVDLWDTYFLNHPEIGNIHNNHPKYGWETFHNAIIEDKKLPLSERIAAESSEIKVHLIDENTAWVEGKIKIIYPNKKVSNNYFYDSLIKTKDGWRVFNSVVNTIPEE